MVDQDNTVRFYNLIMQIERAEWRPTLAGCKVIIHQHLDQTLTLTIAGHRVGHYSAEGKLLTPLTKKQVKAVEKTLEEKSQSRLSLSTCKSRTLRGIRTFPPPQRLLTYETGHFICYEKRTFSLANDMDGATTRPQYRIIRENSALRRDLIDSGQDANRRQSNIHEIIAFEVTAANALGLASLPEEPLDEFSEEEISCFNEAAASANINREETPFEALASICSVLVVGLFILTFLAQNYVIPSGSMKNTLLIGDHLVVDRITLMPPASWMPLIRYREPRRGDIVVFIKPVYQPGIDPTDADGTPQHIPLVKRLIGVPGDHIHLRNGIVIVNGVAQPVGFAQPTTTDNFNEFLDDFPAVPPAGVPGASESWAVNFPSYIKDGDLVVPPDMYFMMGDNRHNSLDSRYWGFVPRANIIGRPLFNYWSFKATDGQLERTGIGNKLAWIGHVLVHFFPDTRWKRTFHVVH